MSAVPALSSEEDYRAAGFAGTLGFGHRPALLVVDMMMAYFDRSSPMYAGVEGVIPPTLALIAAARRRGAPVILTQQFNDPGAADTVYARKVQALKLLDRDSPFAALHPDLPAGDEPVLVKGFPSAFYRTDLAERLAAHRVDTLIITGLSTSGCIRATAMDTMLHGLIGIVVREAVGDRNLQQHEANLFDINAKLADVRSLAEVEAWLAGT